MVQGISKGGGEEERGGGRELGVGKREKNGNHQGHNKIFKVTPIVRSSFQSLFPSNPFLHDIMSRLTTDTVIMIRYLGSKSLLSSSNRAKLYKQEDFKWHFTS